MGRSRYKITNDKHPHFLTFTINNWVPIFTRPATTDIIYSAWDKLQQESNFKIYAFIILENHMHLIAQSDCLSKDIKNFKGRTARLILNYLIEGRVEYVLRQLSFFKKAHKKKSRYQFWQEGSQPKLINSDIIMRQKVEYIHNNPVKRGYVELPEHWLYSSARNYQGLPSRIEVCTQW